MRMGIYSDKYKSVDALPDGAVIAIPNDPTNGGRGLALLQRAGLLKLKEGVGFKATPADVVDNPKHFQFKEIETFSFLQNSEKWQNCKVSASKRRKSKKVRLLPNSIISQASFP